LRQSAWLLKVSFSVIGDWNQCFDEEMRPIKVPDNRGKAAKITIGMVRMIVAVAESLTSQGRRLRIKGFTKKLKTEHGINLSRRKVQEILVANDLFAVRTRKRRPNFYQSLRKEIPNGLLSVDGSEFIMWLDGEPYKFNLELSVDVKTFTHTGFSVGDTENSDEVIKVLQAHRKDWGIPLGVLCDSGNWNLSEQVKNYLRDNDIELVPAGPSNPKGNGTDEGAFSQIKQVLGTIKLNLSSPRSLARSVLEKLISLYITMRNRMSVKGNTLTPLQGMGVPTSKEQRAQERQRLKVFNKAKRESGEDRTKLDHLYGLIDYHRIGVEPSPLKRAEKTIKAYELSAIIAAEKAFVKAVNRKVERKNLAYFFAILRNIQQQRDDEAYSQYCRQRYNEQVMVKLDRQKQERQQESHRVEDIVEMLVQAVTKKFQFVKELATKKARQWTLNLMESYQNPGALKNRFAKALDELTTISLEQRNKIWELIEEFLKPKTKEESVTLIS
jgi:hypothetical protein